VIERDEYHDFIIIAETFKLTDSGEWGVAVRIERHLPGIVRSAQFEPPDRCEKENIALACGMVFARQIINGEIPECSVAEL